jgi:hypothetical protein
LIYFDMDGVLRDLCGHIRPTRSVASWDNYIGDEPLMSYINNHLEVLVKSPKTEYFDIIYRQPIVSILTCQPKSWRKHTARWISKHFKKHDGEVNVRYTDSMDEKLGFLGPSDYLVDDCPNFKDFSRIILIRYQYNTHISGAAAIVEDKITLAKILDSGIIRKTERKGKG